MIVPEYAYRVKRSTSFHPVNYLGMVGIQIKENTLKRGVLPDSSGRYEYEKLFALHLVLCQRNMFKVWTFSKISIKFISRK